MAESEDRASADGREQRADAAERGERELQKVGHTAEHEAGEMESRSGELEHDIESVRQDWERKRADPNVPGAPPREDSADHDAPPADVADEGD